MKTLLAHFDERRATLQNKLDAAESLATAVALLQEELDSIQRQYISDLTAPQARLASPMLAVLRLAVSMLVTANRTSVWYQSDAARPESSVSPSASGSLDTALAGARGALALGKTAGFLSGVKPRVLQGVICIGLLVGLYGLAQLSLAAWAAIALLVILVGLELLLHRRARGTQLSGAEPKVQVGVDGKALLEQLAAALDTIDRTVPDATGARDESAGGAGRRDPIEAVPELLEVIQNLLTESSRDDAQLTLKRSKELLGVLDRYGIRVQCYEPGEENEASDWFDFEPSLDPNAEEYRSLKPALVKDGKALLRGRVVTPADRSGKARAANDRADSTGKHS